MTLLQLRNVNKLSTVTQLPTLSPCTHIESYHFSLLSFPPTLTHQAEPILFCSLNIAHVTSGIRADNPRTTTMPPDTRTTEIKRMEDAIAAVKQDSGQKYEQLVDILKEQSLKLDQTIEKQGTQINDTRHMKGPMAQQIEFTLLKLSQAPRSSSYNTERPVPSPEGAEFRDREPHEDRMSTYKVHRPKHFFPYLQRGRCAQMAF